MSEQSEKKPVDLRSLFGSSDDKTGEQLLNDQYTVDENLAMKTETKDILTMTLLDIFVKRALDKNYKKLESLLKYTSKSIDSRMVSKDRKGRVEFKDSWVALMETNMRKKEGIADQIFGGAKR